MTTVGTLANNRGENEKSSVMVEQYYQTEQENVCIPLSEFDLLQSCQKIIDAASSMKCIKCCKIYPTTDFYDHIIVQRECVIESDNSEIIQSKIIDDDE